ncbi:MAG: 1,6-dihydroxycyclohexa-2,4-diene-1-carboxylate dehydrogenase [Pseudomonadota bacterium]
MLASRFANKVAVVTGAAQGIGRATAMRLAEEGATVVVVDRADEACLALQKELEALDRRALAIVADLETHEGARRVIRTVVERFGAIDVAVHNVGGTIWNRPFWEYSDEQIEKEINRSLWPTIWCCREVIPVMMSQKSGAIVNVGSVATRGIHRVPYSAAKGGVHAMTVCMAMELAEHNIRVNCVAPGGVNIPSRVTPRNAEPLDPQELAWLKGTLDQTVRDTPQQRFGEVDEIAAAICFLAADEASYITGQILTVAGGGIS